MEDIKHNTITGGSRGLQVKLANPPKGKVADDPTESIRKAVIRAKKPAKRTKPGRVSCKNCIYFREYSFDYKEMSRVAPNDGWCRKRCKMKQLADSCKCFTPNKADE